MANYLKVRNEFRIRIPHELHDKLREVCEMRGMPCAKIFGLQVHKMIEHEHDQVRIREAKRQENKKGGV